MTHTTKKIGAARNAQPLLAAGVVTALLALCSTASASKTVVALDADVAVPVAYPHTHSGGGGAVRVGREFGLVVVSLTPEIGASYYKFAGDPDAAIYRMFAGGRVAVGSIVEPSVFTHIAFGKLQGTADEHFAPVLDVGLAVDFTLIPVISFGVHGAYNAVLPRTGDSAFRWVSLGLQAAVHF